MVFARLIFRDVPEIPPVQPKATSRPLAVSPRPFDRGSIESSQKTRRCPEFQRGAVGAFAPKLIEVESERPS